MSKAKTNDYSSEREQLIELGFPFVVVEHALSLKPSGWAYLAAAFGFFFVMVAGFVVGAFAWGPLQQLTAANAIAFANTSAGILYEHNSGFAMTVAVFAWIFLSGVLTARLLNRSDDMHATLFVYTFTDPEYRPFINMPKLLAAAGDQHDPNDFMRQLTASFFDMFLMPGILLAVLALVVLELEVKTFTVYSPVGYIARPLLPWEQDKSADWSDANGLELGCNHTTGRNASDGLVYEVVFADGSSRRLEDAMPVEGSWLDQIEKIDAALVAAGVQIRRWQWLERDPLHPACIEAQRRLNSADDFERIRRLLRVGDFPEDFK